MERQRIGIVVYLHISIVLVDNFADAFQSETMLMAMGYIYSRTAVFCYERICPAGIYDRQNCKRSFYFLPVLISINDSGMFSAAFTALSSRLQNNEVRSLSAIKICRSASYIDVKSYVAVSTLFHIAA